MQQNNSVSYIPKPLLFLDSTFDIYESTQRTIRVVQIAVHEGEVKPP